MACVSPKLCEKSLVAAKTKSQQRPGDGMGRTWSLKPLVKSCRFGLQGHFSSIPWPSGLTQGSLLAVPACHSRWRRCECGWCSWSTSQISSPSLAVLGFPKHGAHPPHNYYLANHFFFFLTLIIFILCLGLQGKVTSFFQTFLCSHRDLCSAYNTNELQECYISLAEAFEKLEKII